MNKPTKVVVEHWDYHQCEEYIAEKLGYDLRDTLGKFRKDKEYDKTVEYRDFWHFLIENNNVHNPCYILIDSYLAEGAEPWQQEIINAFVEEFGDDEEYWVEW